MATATVQCEGDAVEHDIEAFVQDMVSDLKNKPANPFRAMADYVRAQKLNAAAPALMARRPPPSPPHQQPHVESSSRCRSGGGFVHFVHSKVSQQDLSARLKRDFARRACRLLLP